MSGVCCICNLPLAGREIVVVECGIKFLKDPRVVSNNENVQLFKCKRRVSIHVQCCKMLTQDSSIIDASIREQYVKDSSSTINQRDTKSRLARQQSHPKLPENFKIGAAIGDGDCFFDSVAQGLKQLKPYMEFTIKSLRKVCKDFAIHDKQFKDKVINDAKNYYDPTTIVPEISASDDELWNAYLASIEYTSDEIREMRFDNPFLYRSLTSLKYGSVLRVPVWGRPEIEGQMICKAYDVKLHLIEKSTGVGIWLHQVMDATSSRSVENPDYNDIDTVHVINKGRSHFEPVLHTQKIHRHTRLFSDNSHGQLESRDLRKLNVMKIWPSNKERAVAGLNWSIHGNDYQLKLLMMFAAKAENSEVAFRLVTEMAETEKFDDVVFRCTNTMGDIKYWFLQAKYREILGENNKIKVSDLKSESNKNDFSLQKYFISYLRNIQKEEFHDGVSEYFIICTNTDFEYEPVIMEDGTAKDSTITWETYFSEKKDEDEIFTLGGKCYQFSNDPRIRSKITSELKPIFEKSLEKNKLPYHNIHEIDGFLDNLVFVVKQPTGANLEQKIKDRIGDEFNLINDIVYNDYFWFMHDWMKHHIKDSGEVGKRTVNFLTREEIKQLLYESRQMITNLRLISSTILCKRKIEKFGIRFKNDNKAVQKIKEFFCKQSSEKKILLVYSKTVLLSKIKVYQILANQGTSRSIFSDLESLLSLVGTSANPVSAFNSLEKDYLIIENLSVPDKDAENLLNSFQKIVMNGCNKKIIFITKPEQTNNIQMFLKNEKCVEIMEDDNNKLDDHLISLSKDRILETEITLFGKKIKLSSLTTNASKDLYSIIDGDTLTTLIDGGSIEIGGKHEYDFDTYIDVPRTLTYQTRIDKKCLKEINDDLFAIIGIEKSNFSQLVPKNEKIREFNNLDPGNKTQAIRFIRLDNRRDIKKDFSQLCLNYKGRNVHLLENKGNTLELKQTHGSLFNLRKFILTKGNKDGAHEWKHSYSSLFNIFNLRRFLLTENHSKQIKDVTDSAIIAGEPGIGKSTLLTTYSMETNSLWCIKINLRDYETYIHKANFGHLKGVVNFLSDIIHPEKSKTSLITNLLQYCLKQHGQVTILLDGYDEIKNHSQEKIVQLLRTLKTTQGKVLITTRSCVQSKLEDALGIFAYSLNRFDENEQKEFLKQFWMRRLNVNEKYREEKIDKFTKELLNHFHKLSLMEKDYLKGIVLQMRMLAEVYEEECKRYLECEEIDFSKLGIISTFDLYERFTVSCNERYLKEKLAINKYLDNDLLTSFTSLLIKEHGYLALKSLFSENQIQGLLRKDRFSQKDLQEIGFIKIFNRDSRVGFLHPTYAEYFAADLLVDALKKETDHPKYIAAQNFLLSQIFRDRNKVICDFLINKIEKENDSNLSSKWAAIQHSDLLKEVRTELNLQPEKKNVFPDTIHSPADAVSEKSLSELQQDIEEYMTWDHRLYYYSGDVELYDKLFHKFLTEKDVEALKTTLEFLFKANGNSHYDKANAMFLAKNNIVRAVIHFLSEVKEQGLFNNDEFVNDKLKSDCIKAVIAPDIYPRLVEILSNLKDPCQENNRREHLKELIDFIIPKRIRAIMQFRDLSHLCFILDTFYSSVIQDVKTYITSTENTHKEYATKIIESLKDVICGNLDIFDIEVKHAFDLECLRSFIIDILYHPSVIKDTKSSINGIYKNKNQRWLEKQGVVMSWVLEVLTFEMSEEFNSVLDGTINGLTRNSDGVFVDLINYYVNKARVKELPQVNKLAFVKMLVHFFIFSMKSNRTLPFTPEQLETTLKVVKDLLIEQRQAALAVSESVNFLLLLGKSGLKLISDKKELLVLDPAGEFQYKLSSGYMEQIIELIKWKNKNDTKSRKEFLKKCCEIVEFKKGSIKRKGCGSDLQMLKRPKVENCILNKRESEDECLFAVNVKRKRII